MSFYRKYELERLVQKAEPKTFRAREVAGGRTVFLHLLGGLDAPTRASLLQQVRAAMAAGTLEVLDLDDNEIAPYVVTGVLEDFSGLPAWLNRVSSSPGSGAAPRPPVAVPPPMPAAPSAFPPAAPAQTPGEFTVRFASPESLAPRSAPPSSQMPPAAPVRTPQPPPAPQPPAAPAASAMPSAQVAGPGPGEFTLMFAGSKGPQAAPPPPSAPRPPSRTPAAPPPPPPPPLPAQGGRPVSQFTALYGPGPLSQAPPPPPQSMSPGMPQSGQEPGEFSRLFGAPPGAPADNPAGFAPAAAAKPRAPEAPMPWEPQPPPLPPPLAAAPPPVAPMAPPRPLVETPDTQKVQGFGPQAPMPSSAMPAPPPLPQGESASMWNNAPSSSPQQRHSDSGGQGEFTKFFASPLASSSLPIEEIEQGRMAEAMPSADKPFEGPGEFTRWFGKSGPSDKTPPPAPPVQHPTFSGRATGLFEQPNIPAPMAPGEKKGPSEYTRIMAAQQGEAPPEVAAYVPGAAQGRGPLIAIVVVIGLVVIALVVTIILSLRH